MIDIMIDLETTSTDTKEAGILQLSAVTFDLGTGEIGETFNRNLTLPSSKRWSNSTAKWWSQKDRLIILKNQILVNQEDFRTVMQDLASFIRINGAEHFWSKPSHFDFNILDHYWREVGITNPLKYWKARDLRSFLLGLCFPEPIPNLVLRDSTLAHNALEDTLFQTRELIRVYQENKNGK